jgi:abnormal spindle-like microcephaly-associated protein
MHRITMRTDKSVHKDLGVKKKLLMLLLNYNPLWLRVGLETVFGQIIPMQGTVDVLALSQFIVLRLLSNPDILAMFAHATVPHHYKEGHEAALRKFTLKKVLNLIYFLDQAKTYKIIKHNPCLFVKDSSVKMSKDVLCALSRYYIIS